MKDVTGVLHGFSEHVDHALGAHLLLVDPAVHGVADDPHAAAALDQCITEWRALPPAFRARVQPLVGGLALGVTEAMWKECAIIAFKVGSAHDQLIDGESGRLLSDPRDLAQFGAVTNQLLRDARERRRLGAAARRTVTERFLVTRHLRDLARLCSRLATWEFAEQPVSKRRWPRRACLCAFMDMWGRGTMHRRRNRAMR